MSDKKLKYVGGSAKVGVADAGVAVERGGEASFDASVAAALLKSGNWEEVKSASHHTKKEDK